MREQRDPELSLPKPIQFLRYVRRFVEHNGIDDRHGRYRQFVDVYHTCAPLWPAHNGDAVVRQLKRIFRVQA